MTLSKHHLAIPAAVVLVIGAVLIAAFAVWENHANEPILTLHLFESRAFTVAVILSFLVGVALFGTLTFLPLYAQGVLGYSAQDSGLVLAPMMLGFVIGRLHLIGRMRLSFGGGYQIATTHFHTNNHNAIVRGGQSFTANYPVVSERGMLESAGLNPA